MTEPITSFARLLDPVAPETFFAEAHHRKPLHVPGGPGGADKFASVMSWDILNEMLAMDVWDANTLQLVLDPQSLAASKAFQRGFGVQRNPYDLPNL